MKKIAGKIFNRMVITAVLVLLQIGFFIFELVKVSQYTIYISIGLTILSIVVVFYLICQPINPTIKIAWIVPILLFPFLGGLLYLLFGRVYIPKRFRENLEGIERVTKDIKKQEKRISEELENQDLCIANQSRYLYEFAKAPIFKNTKTDYFKVGEEYWEALKEDLRHAEKFIFMEFFIVQEGTMWNEIHEILREKVKQGVEVRFLYDDMGCSFVLPNKYYQRLEKEGIKSRAFNKLVPFMDLILNNRDHRKIAVIDGKAAYTGGINLSDEYINDTHRFGHWKDTGIRLEGDAVWSFTVMFLEMWNTCQFTDEEMEKYQYKFPKNLFEDGYVQPYGDTPLDREVVGENVYINIINAAKRYVYIYTPYLIVDNEMISAITLAAKRGVDVRIVTPGIPDKKMVYWMTQSYYSQLTHSGVKIYQYTPGFIHAKCFLSDDEVATVGTINLDYRSLYHHFECGVWLYRSSACQALKKDMQEVFAVSQYIDEKWMKGKKVSMKLLGPLLKLFAPLL
ncbi:MAG: cardiolipin synthase [Acetivibrio sp.]